MKTLRAIPILLLTVALACAPQAPKSGSGKAYVPNIPKAGGTPSSTAGTGSICVSGSQSPSQYTAQICISAPAKGATLTKDTPVSVNVTVTAKQPGVQHVAFYLDGKPLLEDFTAPYKFVLPSNFWVDGAHTLSAEALLRDGYTTPQASIPVTFNNGVSAAPQTTQQFQPTSGTAPAAGQPFVVAAVGDGAGGDPTETQVVNQIASWNPNLFLYLGDVYEQGTTAEFYNWYRPNDMFGRFRSITDPTVGNHEYLTHDASAYKAFWGNPPDYYSFDAGGWHFISLDSNTSKVSAKAGSPQYQWLQNDLANNKAKCTVVYYHHPYVSIGKEGPTPSMSDIWQLMEQYHVTMVLNGHDHEYQRWTPLDANSQPSPTGITEFVVGTGGHSLTLFVKSDPNVVFSVEKVFGALRLQLNPTSANFAYIKSDGTTLDSGTVACQGQ